MTTLAEQYKSKYETIPTYIEFFHDESNIELIGLGILWRFALRFDDRSDYAFSWKHLQKLESFVDLANYINEIVIKLFCLGPCNHNEHITNDFNSLFKLLKYHNHSDFVISTAKQAESDNPNDNSILYFARRMYYILISKLNVNSSAQYKDDLYRYANRVVRNLMDARICRRQFENEDCCTYIKSLLESFDIKANKVQW